MDHLSTEEERELLLNPLLPYYSKWRTADQQLQRSGIERFQDLCQLTDDQLLEIRWVGPALLSELRSWQREHQSYLESSAARQRLNELLANEQE